MRFLSVLIVCTILFFSCEKEIKIEREQENIFVEDISNYDNESYKFQNLYNVDNEIYLPEREFIFQYIYIDSTKKQFLFKNEGYDLLSIDSISDNTISEIALNIQNGFGSFDNKYDQTVSEYLYYLPNGEAIYPRNTSGIIENKENVWMHPFRNPCYFRLLQFSPYPYIKRNYEVGEKWFWELETGSHYGCKSWKEWKGVVLNKYEYKITERNKIFKSQLGELSCTIVEATGKSSLGHSSLTSYFNEKYGFVRLDYQNIDKSRLIIELTKVIEKPQ